MGSVLHKHTVVQMNDSESAQRFDPKMAQNILLIWLDSNIDQANTDCQHTLIHLKRVINNIHTFTNIDDCVQFLQKNQYDKICMIVSGSLGKQIIPHVHHMSYIATIFIFCGNTQSNEQWVQDWPKIKGVHTDIKSICYTLQQFVKDCEHNGIGFSLVESDDISKNLNQLDPMFICTWILKDILFDIEFESEHFLGLIKYCREILEKDNKNELQNIAIFEQEYTKKTPIWWYTSEFFLYSLVNKTLYLLDISVIMKIGFFIRDLHQQIDDMYQEQFAGGKFDQSFTVYRGQGMFMNEFKKVLKTKGGLISINSFLLTSTSKTIPMKYVERALLNSDKVGVLFVIKIKPNQSTTSFASITGVSVNEDKQDEIIFTMNTLFRIRNIKQVGRNARLFQLKLELIDKNDDCLTTLRERIHINTFPNLHGWNRLGTVLLKFNKSKEGEKVYRIMLEQENEESKKGRLYNRLGWCKYEQVEYEAAIGFYRKSIEIYEKYFPNDPDLAMSFNNIALVYDEMGEYTRALSYYEKALAIKQQQQSLSPNGLNLEALYDNISYVYVEMGEYTKALSYKEKILESKQQISPPNHLDLLGLYNNIGVIYETIENYSKAYSFYEKALQHAEQSLSENHPDYILCKNNRDRVKKQL